MKDPYRGWMTFRCNPIWPRPAATATGLWDTVQILPGYSLVSMGKPTGAFMARIPWSSRRRTIFAATSLVLSPDRWNSRLASDRAGLRIGSLFMRQAKLTRVFVDGKALRIKGFSVAISGLPMLTKPTSSAPASRHIWRKTLCGIVWGVVDGTLLRRAMTEG